MYRIWLKTYDSVAEITCDDLGVARRLISKVTFAQSELEMGTVGALGAVIGKSWQLDKLVCCRIVVSACMDLQQAVRQNMKTLWRTCMPSN